jgi:hypothetical protein
MAANLRELLLGHSFQVTMTGGGNNAEYFTCGFKSVKGVKLATAFEPLQVGGQNDGPALLPIPVSEPGRLTLERGKVPRGQIAWFAQGRSPAGAVSITVLDASHKEAAGYLLRGAVIESVELGALDALASEVLIESVTILYAGITEKSYAAPK